MGFFVEAEEIQSVCYGQGETKVIEQIKGVSGGHDQTKSSISGVSRQIEIYRGRKELSGVYEGAGKAENFYSEPTRRNDKGISLLQLPGRTQIKERTPHQPDGLVERHARSDILQDVEAREGADEIKAAGVEGNAGLKIGFTLQLRAG